MLPLQEQPRAACHCLT
ncbi:unnamed protein product [Linum tenue]|uniref:Uncharacterized protein n=1 Tax=Linum tenue TaxID=586396 RepID=A0AAV0NQ88_9ROSI|nr:unnamed protein product [Linum tenue]